MQQHFSLLCARLVHSLNDNNNDPDPCLLVCSTAALFNFMMHVYLLACSLVFIVLTEQKTEILLSWNNFICVISL